MFRIFACLALFVCALHAQEDLPMQRTPLQTRSMVITKFGIVATSHTLASQAGALVLEHGGNAIDAAIAANATLGVVQAGPNGVGGHLFAIRHQARSGKRDGPEAKRL